MALGYRQLLEVERCFRSLKTDLDIRPVYHHLERRIRSHVVLCWLALLVARICEERTGRPWPAIRDEMQRLRVVAYRSPAGEAQQCTLPTADQAAILAALGTEPPPRYWGLQPGTAQSQA